MPQSNLIRLYSLTPYDRAAKARWMLTELGLAFEDRRLNRQAKEHESPEFLRLNPMGRVPVLEHGDSVIFESGAICAYLGDLHLDKGLAPALASPQRAQYQQWMYFASATLDTIQTRIMVIEDIPAGEVRTQKEAALVSDLRDAMSALDQTLAHQSYLVANRFSAADVCVSYQLYWLTLWPELNVVIDEFPKVVAYLERMKNSPSALKADVFSYSP
jgi:glutathione S-transferase